VFVLDGVHIALRSMGFWCFADRAS